MTDPSLNVLTRDPLNAEALPSALEAPITPTEQFFVRTHFPIPPARLSAWRLQVSGEVDRPKAWTLAELEALPHVRVVATLECAGNGRRRFARPAPGELRWGDYAVGTAAWEGVPLAEVLRRSGVRLGALHVVFSGADRPAADHPAKDFSRSLSVGQVEAAANIVIATRMNGRQLSPEHGFPARLVVPGWYGMAWVKWLTSIEVQRTEFRGYFQADRYIYRYREGGRELVRPVDRLRVKSLVVAPAAGTRLTRGQPTEISGKAWSGTGPIVRVDVDRGAGWEEARLLPGEGPYDWTTFDLPWTPPRAGSYLVRARATDASGETQPDRPWSNQFQYGSNGVHAVRVEVV